MHTTPLANRTPREPQKTVTYQAASGYAVPKSVPGLPGAWSAQIPSTELKLRSKLKKNRGKKMCPEFQMKKTAKDHDTRKTVTGPSVCRIQTSKIKNVTFVDRISLTFAFSILFSEQKWHSSWLFHSSLAKKLSRTRKRPFVHLEHRFC